MHFLARLPYHNLTITPTKPLLLPPPFCVSAPNNSNPNTIFRRDLFASSSLLLLLVAPDPLRAQPVSNDDDSNSSTGMVSNDDDSSSSNGMVSNDDDKNSSSKSSSSSNCDEPSPTSKAFLDISVDGEPIGRITIGLYGEGVPAGASRFSDLVSGAAGVSYRRKEFIKIMPNYVQHGGIRSYGVDAELARKRRGNNLGAESLMDEWEKANENCKGRTRNVAGSVGIIVRNPSKPPPKVKVVARDGKLKIDQEEVGIDPNGTEFVITVNDSPELDSSALVVGKVLQGMEVVEKIGQVKTVQENSTSPYFRVAKLIGDKRAVVAERGFNRPYSKVVVTNCGLME